MTQLTVISRQAQVQLACSVAMLCLVTECSSRYKRFVVEILPFSSETLIRSMWGQVSAFWSLSGSSTGTSFDSSGCRTVAVTYKALLVSDQCLAECFVRWSDRMRRFMRRHKGRRRQRRQQCWRRGIVPVKKLHAWLQQPSSEPTQCTRSRLSRSLKPRRSMNSCQHLISHCLFTVTRHRTWIWNLKQAVTCTFTSLHKR